MLFGQRLVESGIVTVDNVQTALKAQAAQGGRLGTNLLKKGFIDIDTLATALSKHSGAPAAKLKHFDQVDRDVLALVPGVLAARRMALPLATVNRGAREILVAFRDPHDTEAIEEIAHVTGAKIRVFVAPELCILRHLERYYGIRVELAAPLVDDDEGAPPLDAMMQAAQWLPSLPPAAAPPAGTPSPPASPTTSPTTPPTTPPTTLPLTLEAALARLDLASDRDAIGDALQAYLRAMFGVGIVFIVKNDIAYGWRGFGAALDYKEVGALAIPLNATTVLSLAYRLGQPFRGAPQEGEGVLQSHFFRLIHTEAPSEVIVVPIAVKKRVVNLVYAQAQHGGRIQDTAAFDLSTLCRSAGESFVRLIRKRKAH
jgi:hypothetical protein